MISNPLKHKLKLLHLHSDWDKIVIATISLFTLLTLFIPFLLSNSLDKFDHPGLLSLSWFIREYRFPDFAGWNPYFFAGHPQGTLYPPLFHWLVAGLGKIVSLELSYKLVLTTVGILIPYSLYSLNKRIYKQKSWSLLSTLFCLIALVVTPGYLGFNFDGLFDYGLGPSFMTIPFFFWYLAELFKKGFNPKKLAVLFTIMVLTNLVAPFVAGLITVVWFVIKNKGEKKAFVSLVKFVLISFTLTAFWLIPYILYRKYTATGFPMTVPKSLSLIAFFGAATLLLLKALFPRINKLTADSRQLKTIIIITLLISIFSTLDSFLNANQTTFSIPPIHPFRLLIFAFLGISLSITSIIRSFHPTFLKIANRLRVMKLFKRDLHIAEGLVFFSLSLFVLSFLRLNPRGVAKIRLTDNVKWDGRIVRSYKVSEVLDQSRAVIDRSIMQNPENFAMDGLLKESAYLAPYIQSLEKSLDSENYDWENLDQYYTENRKVPEKKTQFLLNLLWIKNAFVIDKDVNFCESTKSLTKKFTSNSQEKGLTERIIYLCKLKQQKQEESNNLQSANYKLQLNTDNSSLLAYSSSPIAQSSFLQILTTQPQITTKPWDKTLHAWWFSNDQTLFTDKLTNIKPQTSKKEFDYKKLSYKWGEDFQTLTIKNENKKELPVIVKVSYFPKWKAYDEAGNEKEITRISPNLMLLPVKDEVTLKYEKTSFETATLIISITSLIMLLFASFYSKVKSKRPQISRRS